MRAVLDTVVFLRALINPKSVCGRLLFDLSGQYLIVVSPDIVREILTVLSRPALRERFPQIAGTPQIARILALFEEAEVAEAPPDVEVCRDPDDNKFFACAASGNADYIVSEDNDILAVGEYGRIKTIDTADFIELLEQRGLSG